MFVIWTCKCEGVSETNQMPQLHLREDEDLHFPSHSYNIIDILLMFLTLSHTARVAPSLQFVEF